MQCWGLDGSNLSENVLSRWLRTIPRRPASSRHRDLAGRVLDGTLNLVGSTFDVFAIHDRLLVCRSHAQRCEWVFGIAPTMSGEPQFNSHFRGAPLLWRAILRADLPAVTRMQSERRWLQTRLLPATQRGCSEPIGSSVPTCSAGLARPEALFTYVSAPSARSRICLGQPLPLHGTLRAEGLPRATSLSPTKTLCAWMAPYAAYADKRAAAPTPSDPPAFVDVRGGADS